MKDLTKGNIYKTFFLFAIPLVLSGILNQTYSLIDTIIAGKYLGSDGLAATGCTSGFESLVAGLFGGYTLGISTYIASLFGAKKYKEIKTIYYHNQVFIAVLSIFLGVVALIFDDYILKILQVDPVIYDDAKIYMNIILLGAFVSRMNVNSVYTLNAFGIASYTFYVSLASAVLNVVGNIVSITMLEWGVAGVAISTVFSSFVVYFLYAFKIRQCFNKIGVANEKVHFSIRKITRTFDYTLPCMAQQSTMFIASFILSPMINGIGSSASAAYAIAQKIHNICITMYSSSSRTLNNYAAQCLGSGKHHLLKKGVRVGLLQSIAFVLPPILLCSIFAKPICASFFPADYVGESLQMSILFARYYLPFTFLHLIVTLFHSFYRGVGKPVLVLVLTAIGSVSRIIFSAIFIHFYGFEGVYIGWLLSWAAEAIVIGITYFSGMWQKKSGSTL